MDNLFLQWNIRGFRRNFDFLQILIQQHQPVAIALQETRITKAASLRHTEDPDFLKGYTPYLSNDHNEELNQDDSTQHGIGILINSNFISSPIDLGIQIDSCQVIAVQVSIYDSTITLCSLYRKSAMRFTKQDLDTIVSKLPKPFIILGDFNAHSTLWGNNNICSTGKVIEDFLDTTNDVTIFNTKAMTYLSPTHGTYSSIDLTLCSANILLDYYWDVLDDLHGSDHFPIILNKVQTHDPVEDVTPQYNIKKADWKKFRNLCIQEFSSDLSQDPDHINIFTEGIHKIIQQSIPTTKPNGKRPKPWFNQEVKDACRKCKAAHRCFHNNPTPENLANKKIMRAKSRRVIKNAKRKSWRGYVGNLNRYTKIKKVWDMVRKISGKYNSQPYKHLINKHGEKLHLKRK